MIYPRFLGSLIVSSKFSDWNSILSSWFSESVVEIFFLIPGNSNICAQEGLFFGSTYKQFLMTFWRSEEKVYGSGS